MGRPRKLTKEYMDMTDTIIDYCEETEIYRWSVLRDYCEKERPDWYEHILTNKLFWKTVLESMGRMARQKKAAQRKAER